MNLGNLAAQFGRQSESIVLFNYPLIRRRTVVDLPSVMSLCGEVAAAVNQVHLLCPNVEWISPSPQTVIVNSFPSKSSGWYSSEGPVFCDQWLRSIKEISLCFHRREYRLDRLLRIGEDRTLGHIGAGF